MGGMGAIHGQLQRQQQRLFFAVGMAYHWRSYTDKILKRQCIIHIVSTVEFSWSIQQHRFNFVGAFSNNVCTR
jgi:hypothetical protein